LIEALKTLNKFFDTGKGTPAGSVLQLRLKLVHSYIYILYLEESVSSPASVHKTELSIRLRLKLSRDSVVDNKLICTNRNLEKIENWLYRLVSAEDYSEAKTVVAVKRLYNRIILSDSPL
jgi:hypothetical protein